MVINNAVMVGPADTVTFTMRNTAPPAPMADRMTPMEFEELFQLIKAYRQRYNLAKGRATRKQRLKAVRRYRKENPYAWCPWP
jgi:hypothetical protein